MDRWYGSSFDWLSWRGGAISDLGIPCREECITSYPGSSILKQRIIAYCPGEELGCRGKRDETAVAFINNDEIGWFHLRNSEFEKVWGFNPKCFS